MSTVEMLGAKLSSSVGSQKRKQNHQPLMAIVELLGATLSLSVGNHHNESQSRWVELLGTKPPTLVRHMEMRLYVVGVALLAAGRMMVNKLDLAVMDKEAQSLPTPMVTS